MATFSVTIAGVDQTENIDWKSLKIDNVLTRQVDTCRFNVKKFGSRSFVPYVGRVVSVAKDGTVIFAGVIVKVDQQTDDGLMNIFKVECVDYIRLLDNKLVNEDYENKSIDYIINDIITNYVSGFTIVNVNCPIVVSRIKFSYTKVSDCIRQLADLVRYNWYVDYSKDLHFFATGDEAAPQDIIDTDGSYNLDSLMIRKDNRQIKNVVYVRGGKYMGDTFTAVYLGDGNQNVFPLTYEYDVDNFQVTVTGQPYSVGQEPLNNPDIYDVFWNNEARLLRFPDRKLPTNGADVRVGGRPLLPVIAKVRDTTAINDTISAEGGTGEHEFLIIDKTINSKEAARDRGRAELYAYARSLIDGEFETYVDGFVAGQRVRVNSAILGVDEYFIISKVTTKMRTPSLPVYEIELVSTRTLGIIDFLRSLMNKDKVLTSVDPNEITDTVENVDDEIGLNETTTASVSHNPLSDEISLAETTTAQSLDYDVKFVLGPYTPTGTKRVFLLNGSPLA